MIKNLNYLIDKSSIEVRVKYVFLTAFPNYSLFVFISSVFEEINSDI